MVHAFSALDRYFALDTESGSIFMLDEPSFLLIKKMSGEEVSLEGILPNELECARAEIDELIKCGVLFYEREPSANIEPFVRVPLKAMCLNICYDCNLACAYCFAKDEVKKSEVMSIDVAKQAIDFLLAHSKDNKLLEVDFFGGEPLLNYDTIVSTVQYANQRAAQCQKGFKFTITTNALELDDARAKWLNDNMDNIVLSIDGRREVHNLVRRCASGQASYDRVLDNSIRLVKNRGGKEYYVRGTYTSKSLDFDKDVQSLHECGFEQISIEPVVLDGKHPLAITKQHFKKLCASYDKLARYYLQCRKNDKDWFNFFHFMIDFDASPCEKKLISACGAGNEYVAVTPNGSIYPCHQFAGNSQYQLGDIWQGFNNDEVSRRLKESNVRTKHTCEQCWAKYYCGGGCAANNAYYGSGPDKVYEMGCNITKARLEYALAVNAIEAFLEAEPK